MRCEFLGVWADAQEEIWDAVANEESAPDDLFCELYREVAPALKSPPDAVDVASIISNPPLARMRFRAIGAEEIAGERVLAAFFERAHETLVDLGGATLAEPYFALLGRFVEKYSLRYDLRRPCVLSPTLPGVFAGTFSSLRAITRLDPHLDTLMSEFESSVRDLRADMSEVRIKTCIQKQVNLLEGLGRSCSGVTGTTLGAICEQVGTWPHVKIKEAIKSLYVFACDYPGIRHGGTAASALRPMEMRDLIAMSILLAGFVPYLTDRLDAQATYLGS
jgi:hypothetical protein